MLLRGSYHVKRNSVRQAGAAGAPAWTAYALASRCAVPMRRSAPWALTPGRRVAWPAGSGLRPDDRVRREHRKPGRFGGDRAGPRDGVRRLRVPLVVLITLAGSVCGALGIGQFAGRVP